MTVELLDVAARGAVPEGLPRAEPDVRILNDVVLNQVLARFPADDGDHDTRIRAVVAAAQ